jgi:uncharacterized membrane protein (DUF4010 family)
LNSSVPVTRADGVATVKFSALLGILVLLPDQELSYLFGVNPWRVWLVVVFVSAFSFLGYVLTKIVGPEKGIGLTGLLGGCIASTPTVVSMAEQAKRNPEIDSLYAFGALLASIAMIGKVFAIIVVVTPHFASAVVIPFLGMLVVGVLFAFLVLRQYKAAKPPTIELDNRFRVKPGLVFGVIVAFILLGVNILNVSVSPVYAEISAVTAVLVNISFKAVIAYLGGTNYMALTFTGLLILSALVGVGFVIMS